MTTISDGLRQTEAECAAGRTAPRVSLSDIISSIAAVAFISGHDVMMAGRADEPSGVLEGTDREAALRSLTVCLVVLNNGFTVIGKAAPASPDNFDAELGRKLAYEDAVRQIWPLMGYALREHQMLAGEAMALQEAPPVGLPLAQLYLSDAKEISSTLAAVIAGEDTDANLLVSAKEIIDGAIADREDPPSEESEEA